MPIDPTIPLSIAPPTNALATFDAIQNMGALADQRRQLAAERQAQVDKLQQQQEQQAQFQQIIHESLDPASGVVDWDAAYKKMDERGLSTLADTLKKNADAALQSQAKTTGDLLDNHQKTLTQLTSEMRAVRDSGSQGAYQQLVTHIAQAYGPSIAASMPTSPQLAQSTGWFDKATTWADSEENDINRIKALIDAASAKPKDAQAWTNHGAQVLGGADPTVTDPNNPMSYQFRLGLLSLQGMPSPILQQFKGLTPQQAGQMGLTSEQKSTAANEAATRAQTAANEAAQQNRFNLSFGLEKQRFGLEQQKFQQSNAPVDDLKPYTSTTSSGKTYINLDKVQGTADKKRVSDAARAAGIPTVDAKTDAGLQAIDDVRANYQQMMQDIEGRLPKDAQGRLLGGALENKLSKYFQTDPDIAAFGSYNSAAIRTVQALASGQTGLRMSQQVIDTALQNDIPKITDTVATAKKRFSDIMGMLDAKERDVLQQDRSKAVGGGSFSTSYTGSDGKPHTATFPTQAALDAFKKDMGIK